MIDKQKTGLTGSDRGYEYDETHDYMDCRPESKYPASQVDAVTPDRVKKMIEERTKKKDAQDAPRTIRIKETN